VGERWVEAGRYPDVQVLMGKDAEFKESEHHAASPRTRASSTRGGGAKAISPTREGPQKYFKEFLIAITSR
jgi:hypothetical protein